MHYASDSPLVGHMRVHLASDDHPREVEFSFERQGSRMGGFLGASLLTHLVFAMLLVLAFRYAPTPDRAKAPFEWANNQIVWLVAPGPGGGGGGGGNKSPEPPRKVELPGKDKITTPTVKSSTLEDPLEKPKVEDPPQAVNIPAEPLAAALNRIVGAIDGNASSSLGSGIGGGSGTGTGSGIGEGAGSGLGPGSGGGTGGGVYRPGNGVEPPRLLRGRDPQYTSDAMRAKVQGTVEIQCIVETNGICEHIEVVRSLDRVFGLDQEAIKAVQQWRFAPGRRLGQDVAVLVMIEVTFTLR